MAKVSITLNGREIRAKMGLTVYQVAKEAGVDIPTLCHHRALHPVGACRICVVEIKGLRILQSACTFPIFEGMEIETESPKVVAARKLILDMLFAERNHYCPFCEISGDCELQNLGYRYGISHWKFSTYRQPFPLDASRKYFLMDHSRCILCQKCARACSELVANHTLGLGQRGAKSMIHADAAIPFADSTCISCGTCLQVCPTGALVDKRSSYMARGEQSERIPSICNKCSIGCGISIVTRGGNVVRIEGDWDAPVNSGLLCKYGRFLPLYEEERERITQPLLRRKEGLLPAGWDEALQAVADQINKTDAADRALCVSGDATNEALYLASNLFSGSTLQLASGATLDLGAKEKGRFSDLLDSDLMLVVGVNPVDEQPVASFFIKRLVDQGKRLIVVDDKENGLAPFAEAVIKLKDIDKALRTAEKVNHVAVLYGPGLSDKAADALKKLESKARFIPIEPGINACAAVQFGMNGVSGTLGADFVYFLQGELDGNGADILKKAGKKTFLVVQAAYASPLTEKADVVLPSAIWSERSGTLTNTEGRVQTANQAVEPLGDAKADWEILALLAGKLGKDLGKSLKDISKKAAKEQK